MNKQTVSIQIFLHKPCVVDTTENQRIKYYTLKDNNFEFKS